MDALMLFADVVADSVHEPEAASSVRRPDPYAGSIAVSGHFAAFSLVATMLGVLERQWMTASDGRNASPGSAAELRPVTAKSTVGS